jgi:hypothetical protein
MFIPKSVPGKNYVIRPSGKTFITGIAYSYSDHYNEELLKDKISKKTFEEMMN